MTKIKAAMESATYRVDPDSAINDGSLRAQVLIIGEPVTTPTTAEIAKLREFINAGGMVMVFGDTGIDLPTYNNLLTGIGSAIQFTTTTIGTTSALVAGPFTQQPSKIAGNTLSITSGNGTTGGTLIDNNYVRYEVIGNGYVVVFGDRIDHNDVISATNTTLLLNLVSEASGPPTSIPALAPALLVLVSLLLGSFAASKLARKR
ncbi:MAG: hypothetical protein ABJB04_03970 [Betaproteobacteria bacterium]